MFVITGRIAIAAQVGGEGASPVSRPEPRAGRVRSAGYGDDAAGHVWGPLPKDLKIEWAMSLGSFAENERELRHLSDDQAICVGYANSLAECD